MSGLTIHQKTMLNYIALSRKIHILNFYAVYSAFCALYYEYNTGNTDYIKYDQDYAVNNGIIYG